LLLAIGLAIEALFLYEETFAGAGPVPLRRRFILLDQSEGSEMGSAAERALLIACAEKKSEPTSAAIMSSAMRSDVASAIKPITGGPTRKPA
jgi:hypothetical protein